MLTPDLTPHFRCLLQVRTYSLPTLMGVSIWCLLPIAGIGIGLGWSEPLAAKAGFAVELTPDLAGAEQVALVVKRKALRHHGRTMNVGIAAGFLEVSVGIGRLQQARSMA